MKKPYTFIHVVPRSSLEEHTFAVVSVTTSNPDYSSADYTLRRLSAAVREGARQEGLSLADAYAYARDDLNIGDVASHGADEQLVALLGDVDGVSVEVYSSDAGHWWTFDSPLLEEDVD